MLASTLDLLYNLALLVALSVISGFIRQFRGARAWGAILQGALFGGAAVIGMMRPLVLGPGLIFDGRSVMLCLCGLFFGPLAAVTAGGMALLYRILLGGAGATMGVLVIASSVLLGLAFHAGWVRRGQALTVGRLLGLGLLVHGVMVLLMFTLPAGTGLGVIQRLGLPILLAYPLVTVLIGKVLSTQEAALRAIEALRNSKQQYDSLVSKIPVGIYLLHSTPEGAFKLDYASPRMAEMFGVSVEGLLADSHLVFEKIHPDDVDGFGRLNQEGIQERRPFDWKGRILIGETVKWLHISSLPEQLENGDVLWHGLILDITERKQAEDALRESNELLSLFLLHSPIHAYIKEVTPTESRVLQASENFREMIGIPGSEMVGRTMTELFPAEMAEKITADDWAVVSAGKVQEFPEEFNGRSYTTLKFPILQGGRTLLAGYTIDITHRRQAEEERAQLQVQLQQTQKMESLGSLAGGVAHDMNNVLGAILGLASAHLEIQPADSPTYRAFDTISQAALRGGKMVQSLLNFARQSPVEERVLDVNAILMEEVRLLERTTLSRVRLELDLALGLRPIRGDGSALTHAFM